MKTIDELIAYFTVREKEMAKERDRIDAQGASKFVTEEKLNGWSKTFEYERQVARDSKSYLETLKKRLPA